MRLKFIISFLFLANLAHAQGDFMLQSQSLSPHQTLINPSIMPAAEFYLGLPLISNSYASFGNNSFTYRDLVKRKLDSDSIYLDLDGFLSSLNKTNYLGFHANTDLVSIGWREGRWYVGARVSELVNVRLRFDKDLMALAIQGNGPYIGQTLNLGDFFVQGSHLRKYTVFASRDFHCNWRFGASIAYVYGMESIDIQRSNISLKTDASTFDLSGTSDILINTSGLEEYDRDSLKSWPYLFNRPNRGYSVDLGASYKMNERFSFSASLLDLGRVRWRYKTHNYSNTIEEFSFTGISLNQFISSSPDSIKQGVDRFLDSLSHVFSIEETNQYYTTPLPSRMYLGAAWNPNELNTFRFTYLANTFRGKIYSSASLAFSKKFNELLEFSLGWAYMNNSARNLSAGFTLNLGLTQFMILTDNLPGLFGQYSSRGTNIRAGITLNSGYDVERKSFCDKDNDGILNHRDACPDEPGSLMMQGCPDTDQDGIPDAYDSCPDKAGSTEMKGCPDTDRDGIADYLDACPELAGKPEYNGCPDSDADGIMDAEDECPNLPGLIIFKGCPDRDNDSIPDKEDLCPDLKGLVAFSGCPDSDGDGTSDDKDECPQTPGDTRYLGCPDSDKDGISDQHDRCPLIPGKKENRGCPSDDRDGDGIIDEEDRCPLSPGTRANNGCPELEKEESIIVKTAFENLEFESGKSVILKKSKSSLNELAELLKAHENWDLLISGHTDNSGNAAANMLLSKQRVKAVAEYLASKGIDSGRFELEWFGQSKPLVSNATAEGRKKNRRVEMTLIFN